jgi:hypothetical protein
VAHLEARRGASTFLNRQIEDEEEKEDGDEADALWFGFS